MEDEKRTMKSFTGVGDSGTSVIGKDSETGMPIRLSKTSYKMIFWGKMDTLSSYLGTISNRDFIAVQTTLFRISGMLFEDCIDIDFLKKEIGRIERFCRKYEKNMPTEFVRPTGPVHYARALAREAEIAAVNYAGDMVSIEGIKLLLRYMNRLSSYFFTYAECYQDLDDE